MNRTAIYYKLYNRKSNSEALTCPSLLIVYLVFLWTFQTMYSQSSIYEDRRLILTAAIHKFNMLSFHLTEMHYRHIQMITIITLYFGTIELTVYKGDLSRSLSLTTYLYSRNKKERIYKVNMFCFYFSLEIFYSKLCAGTVSSITCEIWLINENKQHNLKYQNLLCHN